MNFLIHNDFFRTKERQNSHSNPTATLRASALGVSLFLAVSSRLFNETNRTYCPI